MKQYKENKSMIIVGMKKKAKKDFLSFVKRNLKKDLHLFQNAWIDWAIEQVSIDFCLTVEMSRNETKTKNPVLYNFDFFDFWYEEI